MNPLKLIKLDVVCWLVLLVALWTAPEWIIKVSVSILIIAQVALLGAVYCSRINNNI